MYLFERENLRHSINVAETCCTIVFKPQIVCMQRSPINAMDVTYAIIYSTCRIIYKRS